MKELTRFEIAACKRVAANTKSLRTKVEKLDAKIEELRNQRDTYSSEIRMWETPIIEKYGFSVDEILNGTYLQPCCCGENPPIDDEEVKEYSDEYPAETVETYNAL